MKSKFQRPVSVSVSVKESMKEADNLFKISNYNDAMRYYDEVISYDLNNIDAHFKKAHHHDFNGRRRGYRNIKFIMILYS